MLSHFRQYLPWWNIAETLDSHRGDILFSALEQNMMGSVLIDADDTIMFFNRAAEQLWGYRREEVLGQNVSLLIPHALRAAHPDYIQHHREGAQSKVVGMSRELQLERKDGSKIWTRFALSRVDISGKICYLALVRDATWEMAQKEQTRLLLLAVDHITKPVIVLDNQRRIVQGNQAFTEMSGMKIDDMVGLRPDNVLRLPDSLPEHRERIQRLLAKSHRDQDEFMLLACSGTSVWFKATINPVFNDTGELQNLVMTFVDVTEDRKIRELERTLLTAISRNPPFHDMGDILCRSIEAVFPGSHVELTLEEEGIWAATPDTFGGQSAIQRIVSIRRRDRSKAGTLSIRTVAGRESRAFIDRVADISQHLAAVAIEQEHSRRQIAQLVQFDPLTGLPNRSQLQDYLDQRLSGDDTAAPVVFLMTVDHFQDVIDAHGYATADQVLLTVANRLRDTLRPGQYLCKTEGPQFVLIDDENDVSNLSRVSEDLENSVHEPFTLDQHTFSPTLSIGISYEAGKNLDWLLSTASSAMDHIRRSGGNGWQFFSPELNRAVTERMLLGAALKRAVSDNHLRLVYQPQINIATGELYGFEALARWRDPEHGDVPPSRFIPLAEEVGEIENIGRWVIREACRQLAQWRSQALRVPALSVNLSALHFHSSALFSQVTDAMTEFSIVGNELTLEITESMMMDPDEALLKRIKMLREAGVGLSIDDFGTGFSGLSRLVTLPVTEIKIDKSFVDGCLTDTRSRSLLEVITRIGQSFNMVVVAEGVETQEQLQLLRAIGCPVVQGYYFSSPLKPEDIPSWYQSDYQRIITNL